MLRNEMKNHVVLFGTMASSKKVKTNIFLTRKQMVALKKLSRNSEVPVARLIRRGIDMLLAKGSKKVAGW